MIIREASNAVLKIIRFWPSRTNAIFISNAQTCPCYKSYQLTNEIKSIKSVLVQNVEGTNAGMKVMMRKVPLIIFVHGDHNKQQFCFFSNRPQNIVHINNELWRSFSNNDRSIYFHSCFGESILRNPLKDVFFNWVTYKNKVMAVHSSNPRVDRINKSFIERLGKEMVKLKKPAAIKSAVEAAYKSIQGELFEEDTCMPGYTAFRALIGNNIAGLVCSADKIQTQTYTI